MGKLQRACYRALYPVAESPVVAGRSQYDAFLRGLRDVGSFEGQSITIDYLSVDGRLERFPSNARARAGSSRVCPRPANEAKRCVRRFLSGWSQKTLGDCLR